MLVGLYIPVKSRNEYSITLINEYIYTRNESVVIKTSLQNGFLGQNPATSPNNHLQEC